MVQLVENKDHLVVKRDGRVVPYDATKLYKVILWACDGSTSFANELLEATTIKINNKIHIAKLYNEVIATAANLISDLYPQWETIAKRLYLLKLHKDIGVKRTEYPHYKSVIDSNVQAKLYSQEVLNRVDLETLYRNINPSYDELFTFGGLNLFVQKYCNKSKGQLLELPQHVYMRVAIQLMQGESTEAILYKYNQLASHGVTEATPKMVNALKPNASMFSCCLNRPSDSLEGINESITMLTKESKYSGGVAWDVSLIRAPGSAVEGNNGISSGAIPYVKALESVISGFNQGGTRSSACICTFDGYHYQSPELAQLKLENGKDEDRVRKLQYSVKWRRHFSNAVKANEDIYLINPHRTQDLFNSYGEEWEELYDKYCKNTHIHKRKYNARELAHIFTSTSADTGNLYYFFPENANEQDIGAGLIPASNLCVSGDTLIHTDKGNFPIATLAGQTVNCWNGLEWTKTPVFKTSDSEYVTEVFLSNGTSIKATAYHKWYLYPYTTLTYRTKDLSVGDIIAPYRDERKVLHDEVTIVKLVDLPDPVPVYCGSEPKRQKLMFNGVLTGNCQEMVMSYEPIKQVDVKLVDGKSQFTFEGDIALCNLSSVNIMNWIHLSSDAKFEFMYHLVKSMDNAIDNSYYVNPLGKKHSQAHRNLGIGISNYANFLAYSKAYWNSTEARKLTHELQEEISFYVIKSSIELAKERSRCAVWADTKWSKGIFPHELSKLGKLDSPLNYPLLQDWESLRPDLLKYGIRNSRCQAIAPTATSGKCINATEGIDPPRNLKSVQEGTYSLPFIVPNLRTQRNYYQTTFTVANKDIIELAAIRQKFICMSQSVSLAYDKLTSSHEHVSNIILAEELGLKTIYYTHTRKAGEAIDVCESCSS